MSFSLYAATAPKIHNLLNHLSDSEYYEDFAETLREKYHGDKERMKADELQVVLKALIDRGYDRDYSYISVLDYVL